MFPQDSHKFNTLQKYLDDTVSDDELCAIEPRLMKSSGEFNAKSARLSLLKSKVRFDSTNIVRYPFKPLDIRLAYLDADIAPLFSRPSPELLNQRFPDNSFLIVRETGDKDPDSPPVYFSSLVCDYHCLVVEAKHIPLFIRSGYTKQYKKADNQIALPNSQEAAKCSNIANLSSGARHYLTTLSIAVPDADAKTAGLIWMHVLAIGYSPAYLSQNADGIRMDWPRVPLPNSKKALLDSVALGEQIAALLDTEHQVSGVTTEDIRPELGVIGVISREDGGQLQEKELAITVGWGHAGQNDVVMPGKGKVIERDYTKDEKEAIVKGAKNLGLEPEDAFVQLGERTCDVYLNNAAYWRNVPMKVWEYYIGGYQVIKKWLSYREQPLLGRTLNKDEAREVMNMARRIATILLLQPTLDANYLKCKGNAYQWPAKA